MSMTLMPPPRFQAVDGTGKPYAGGKVYTYSPGVTTPKVTYKDSTGATLNTNPVILDANGQADIWLSGAYKVVLTDANGVQIYSVDNVTSMTSVATTLSEWVSVGTTLSYISGTQFSVPGDQTTTFQLNRRVQATVSAGTIYGTITGVSFGSSITTVTVTWDTGALDSGLSAVNVGILSATNPSIPQIPGSLVPTGATIPYAGTSAPIGFLLCNGQAVSRTTYAGLFGVISTAWGAGDGGTTFNVPDLRDRTLIGAGTGVWSQTFTASNSGGDLLLTVPSNSTLITGAIFQVSNSGGALPGGLAPATNYYAARISATTIKVATSLANAVAQPPTVIAYSSAGSGTNTLTVTYTARAVGDVGGEETHAQTSLELATHLHAITDPGHLHTVTNQRVAGTDNVSSGAGFGLNSSNTGSATTGITVNNAGTGNAFNIMQPWAAMNWIIKT